MLPAPATLPAISLSNRSREAPMDPNHRFFVMEAAVNDVRGKVASIVIRLTDLQFELGRSLSARQIEILEDELNKLRGVHIALQEAVRPETQP